LVLFSGRKVFHLILYSPNRCPFRRFLTLCYDATLLRVLNSALCIFALFCICVACYRRPVADEFDGLIYEAIVLGKTQPIEVVYNTVKHENQRAEASTILSSPQLLRETEPLYKIRPLYIQVLSWLSYVMPLRRAIDFVSAASFFGIGIVAMLWTGRPLFTVFLMAAYPLLVLARIGTPDALAALLVIAGLWLVQETRLQAAGLACLFVSLTARTDNLLLLLAILGWLVWQKRLQYPLAAVFAVLAISIVKAINYWAGNYGWIVLFRYSFVTNQSPAQISHTLTMREYFSALTYGTMGIATHLALWILLGILAWAQSRNSLFIPIAAAVIVHFLMFPSTEDRYFVWAYIVVGILMIRSFRNFVSAPAQRPGWAS
jgi:hypothetical protein